MGDKVVEAYVGLGSNMDDPVAKVRAGMAALATMPATRLEQCSSLYGSAPIGVERQPDFVNAACRLLTGLSSIALLERLLAIELEQGRQRPGPVGGPRPLDLDLLLYDEQVCDLPRLTLPHPRLHERAFVLLPLIEITPNLVVPGKGKVQDLAARCAGQRVERISG
jgi:2-amino-4-hydroxy-6-hydroxymethyldihydropteridine diphosphokinase